MSTFRQTLRYGLCSFLLVTLAQVTVPAQADELLQMIQTDLEVLGYDPGSADGKLTMKTQLAIGKFEEANEMPVTGKPSLAVAAAVSNQADAVRSGSVAAAVKDPAAAEQARIKCLQELAARKQQQESGLRSMANAGANIAGRFGGRQLARDIQQIARTAEDVSGLAGDLGLTATEAAECD